MKKTTHAVPACLLAIGLISVSGTAPTLKADTYDVNVNTGAFLLYTDPYNGNEIRLGGFSGLYPVPGQPDCFYTISDRGPAPDFVMPGPPPVTLKTWAIPNFGPHLITVRLMPNGTAKVDDVKPLKRPNGGHITGFPTTLPATDVPFDFDLNQLPYDEDSLDAEGITIDPWGNFWICEEYKPSVAMIAPNGKVQLRLVPEGTVTGFEEVPTYGWLPAVLAKRRSNRGLEGIAAASDGILYSIMQRPLSNPNRAAGDSNGNTRLLAIDLNTLLHGGTAPLVRQFLYRIPVVPNNVTLSDLFSTAPGKVLVTERATDKLYEADVAGATDITPLENAAGKVIALPTKTIEQLTTADLESLGIVPVTKTVVIDSLMAISPLMEKVEGVCVVGDTIVFTYDNDFNVAEAASIPLNPNPNGPFVQLELLGANYPKIFTVPMP